MDQTQRYVELACAVLLLVLVVFGDAIIETIDPGRIDRRIAHNIEVPPEPTRTTWADRPNGSRCGWNCIGRLPQGGETWGE